LQVRLDSPLALPWGPTPPVFPEQHFEQLPHLSPVDEWMTQGQIRYHLVAVPPALPLAQHVALLDQLGEDPVGGALGDPDCGGDVPQADSGVISNAAKDVGVVGQEVPRLILISRKRIHEYMIHLSSIHCKEASHGRNRNHRTTVDTARAFGDAATTMRAGRVAHPTGIADTRAIADPGRSTTNGDGPMMTSSVVGDRAAGNGLPAELTAALASIWTQYAGKPPSRGRTEIRGNVVTCVLVDAVGDYNRSMIIAAQTRDTVQGVGKQGVGKLSPAAYKRDAVAAVVRLTRQRVASFLSSHDRDTDVATEVFTLEPSFNRGAPSLADRRRGGDFRLFPARVV
jgi:hypothetical protein